MRKVHSRKSILVTGSSGFIGKAITDILVDRGYDVIRFDRQEGNDVLDRARLKTALSHADGVIHLGSPSSMLDHLKDRTGSWNNAITGLVNILELYKGRIVFPSTCTLYGSSEFPASETLQLPEPSNPYAAVKVECERLCLLYNLKGRNSKIVRIFTGYGPEEWQKSYPSPVTNFIKEIYKGKNPSVYGDGTQVRDFVFIDDIVNCLVMVLETQSHEYIFNVGTGKATSFIEVIQLINRAMGIHSEPLFGKNDPPERYAQSIVADLTLSHLELGYKPSITIEEGIKRTVEAYITNEKRRSMKD